MLYTVPRTTLRRRLAISHTKTYNANSAVDFARGGSGSSGCPSEHDSEGKLVQDGILGLYSVEEGSGRLVGAGPCMRV
jgi:hypothetical protein